MLEFTNVTRNYILGHNTIKALQGINLKIATGETTALVGPSGSGKTTILALAAGLDRPSSGSVRLAGSLLSDLFEDQLTILRRDNVGFVFQNYELLPNLDALENVMVGLELKRERQAKEIALACLKQVGLLDRSHHLPSQLSGGEQQRVALARAFATNPKILLADEPTGSLDAPNAEIVANLLFERNSQEGTTLLIATHNEELAARCARRVNLRAGQIVQ